MRPPLASQRQPLSQAARQAAAFSTEISAGHQAARESLNKLLSNTFGSVSAGSLVPLREQETPKAEETSSPGLAGRIIDEALPGLDAISEEIRRQRATGAFNAFQLSHERKEARNPGEARFTTPSQEKNLGPRFQRSVRPQETIPVSEASFADQTVLQRVPAKDTKDQVAVDPSIQERDQLAPVPKTPSKAEQTVPETAVTQVQPARVPQMRLEPEAHEQPVPPAPPPSAQPQMQDEASAVDQTAEVKRDAPTQQRVTVVLTSREANAHFQTSDRVETRSHDLGQRGVNGNEMQESAVNVLDRTTGITGEMRGNAFGQSSTYKGETLTTGQVGAGDHVVLTFGINAPQSQMPPTQALRSGDPRKATGQKGAQLHRVNAASFSEKGLMLAENAAVSRREARESGEATLWRSVDALYKANGWKLPQQGDWSEQVSLDLKSGNLAQTLLVMDVEQGKDSLSKQRWGTFDALSLGQQLLVVACAKDRDLQDQMLNRIEQRAAPSEQSQVAEFRRALNESRNDRTPTRKGSRSQGSGERVLSDVQAALAFGQQMDGSERALFENLRGKNALENEAADNGRGSANSAEPRLALTGRTKKIVKASPVRSTSKQVRRSGKPSKVHSHSRTLRSGGRGR